MAGGVGHTVAQRKNRLAKSKRQKAQEKLENYFGLELRYHREGNNLELTRGISAGSLMRGFPAGGNEPGGGR